MNENENEGTWIPGVGPAWEHPQRPERDESGGGITWEKPTSPGVSEPGWGTRPSSSPGGSVFEPGGGAAPSGPEGQMPGWGAGYSPAGSPGYGPYTPTPTKSPMKKFLVAAALVVGVGIVGIAGLGLMVAGMFDKEDFSPNRVPEAGSACSWLPQDALEDLVGHDLRTDEEVTSGSDFACDYDSSNEDVIGRLGFQIGDTGLSGPDTQDLSGTKRYRESDSSYPDECFAVGRGAEAPGQSSEAALSNQVGVVVCVGEELIADWGWSEEETTERLQAIAAAVREGLAAERVIDFELREVEGIYQEVPLREGEEREYPRLDESAPAAP